jgi:hypothetical protein
MPEKAGAGSHSTGDSRDGADTSPPARARAVLRGCHPLRGPRAGTRDQDRPVQRDVNIKVNSTEDLSDEQLMRKLAALTEMARPLLARITDGAHVEPPRNPEPVVDVEYVDISKG